MFVHVILLYVLEERERERAYSKSCRGFVHFILLTMQTVVIDIAGMVARMCPIKIKYNQLVLKMEFQQLLLSASSTIYCSGALMSGLLRNNSSSSPARAVGFTRLVRFWGV